MSCSFAILLGVKLTKEVNQTDIQMSYFSQYTLL